MNKILIITVAIFIIGGYFLFSHTDTEKSVQVEEIEYTNETKLDVYSNAELEYEFSYPNSYIMLEDTESTNSNFISGVRLFDRVEYEIFAESLDAREGPPAISLRVYNNPDSLHAPVWAMREPLESNIEMALNEPEEIVVGGANAVYYVVDGLYPIDTYVVAHAQKIYVLTGSYLEKDSAIYKDFQSLVDSFNFIPSVSTNMKLYIQAVCEGALAYMTFPSGVEADAFVSDCVEGKHPEVIDRYISEQGLDGAAI